MKLAPPPNIINEEEYEVEEISVRLTKFRPKFFVDFSFDLIFLFFYLLSWKLELGFWQNITVTLSQVT